LTKKFRRKEISFSKNLQRWTESKKSRLSKFVKKLLHKIKPSWNRSQPKFRGKRKKFVSKPKRLWSKNVTKRLRL
jgi:hypothetical protein